MFYFFGYFRNKYTDWGSVDPYRVKCNSIDNTLVTSANIQHHGYIVLHRKPYTGISWPVNVLLSVHVRLRLAFWHYQGLSRYIFLQLSMPTLPAQRAFYRSSEHYLTLYIHVEVVVRVVHIGGPLRGAKKIQELRWARLYSNHSAIKRISLVCYDLPNAFGTCASSCFFGDMLARFSTDMRRVSDSIFIF